MTFKIQTGIYEHYKGKRYEVIGVARHSETLEEVVVYKALYEAHGAESRAASAKRDEGEFGKSSLWVRPLKMFAENVKVNGKEVPRFRFVGNFGLASEIQNGL